MGFLRPKGLATQQIVYAGIQVSGSLYGGAVPLIYGRQRARMNLIWFGDFTSQAGSTSSGKGGGNQNGQTTYNTAFAAALCMGPIVGVANVFHDKSIVTLADEDLTLFLGSSGQQIWSFLQTFQPTGAAFTGYIIGKTLLVTAVGSGNVVPGHTVSGPGVAAGTTVVGLGGGGQIGGYPINISQTVGSPTNTVAMTTNAGAVGSQAIPYDHFCFVATPSYNLGSSAAMPNLTFEVDGFLGYGPSIGVYDADPSAVLIDYLTEPNHGAGFLGGFASNIQGQSNSWQAYCMAMGLLVSPYEDTQRDAASFIDDLMKITNSDCFLSVGTLKVVPYADQPVSSITPDGKQWSYTPILTPEFVFTDNDYAPKAGDEPITLEITPLADTYNELSIEYMDRSNQYNTAIAKASDLADQSKHNQVRAAQTITYHAITDPQVARTVAQLLLQASLYERNTYKSRMRADYMLLEPMDYIAHNDAYIGLTNQVCRIKSVELDEDFNFTIEAVEVPGVIRSTGIYNWASAQGFKVNYEQPPGSIAPPVIFIAPPLLAKVYGGNEIWIAASPTSSEPSWGGCDVWASFDNLTYSHVGRIGVGQEATYGSLTTALPAGSDPDTADTLSVTLTDSSVQLDSGTQADADNFRLLALIDSGSNVEVISYANATLVAPGQYNIKYMRRGLYGTSPPIAHAAGVPFVRFSNGIFRMNADPSWAGLTIFFKFPSFNLYGWGGENLSTATVYSYLVPASFAPPINASSWTVFGNDVVNTNGITKSSAGSATLWDMAYSNVGGSLGTETPFHISAKPNDDLHTLFIGLTSLPVQSNTGGLPFVPTGGYNGTGPRDIANFFAGLKLNGITGNWEIWNRGAFQGAIQPANPGDAVAVSFDGINHYSTTLNGAEVDRGVIHELYLAGLIGLLDPGAGVNSLFAGPSQESFIETGELAPNSVSNVLSQTSSAVTTSGAGVTGGPLIIQDILPQPVGYTATITVVADVWKSGGTASTYLASVATGVLTPLSNPFVVTATSANGTRISLTASVDVPANTPITVGMYVNTSAAQTCSATNQDLTVTVLMR